MKKAVGTSLFIIAIQSLAGFAGDAFGQATDWGFLLPFTGVAIAGIFIGILASRKMDGEKLKKRLWLLCIAYGCVYYGQRTFYKLILLCNFC